MKAPLARLLGAAVLCVCVVLSAGCSGGHKPAPWHLIEQGEYGVVREQLAKQLPTRRGDRRYLLDRAKLGIMTLADGYPQGAEVTFQQVYDMLRTQGLNADRTVSSVVVYEGVKIWKGEPFEQAMTLSYIAMQQAMLGQWDNARAASGNALFSLRDFREESEVRTGRRLDTDEIARRALAYERKQRGIESPGDEDADDFVNSGYAVRESNFTLGYVLNAIANQQLGRTQEADDYLAVAANETPSIKPLLRAIREQRYNTVLIVSYGRGPAKRAYGPDNAMVRYLPQTASGTQALRVRVMPPGAAAAGDAGRAYPVICDVNRMATDHMWNSLQSVRVAKSVIGRGLMEAGLWTTIIAADHDSPVGVAAGLGAILIGALLRGGAQADTRHLDVLPQRYYLVPLYIHQPGTRVALQVDGNPSSRIVLTDLSPPANPGDGAKLTYTRLAHRGPAAPWALSGESFYRNDHGGDEAPGGNLPYLLGGRDLSTPSPATLSRYQRAGNLRWLTFGEYRRLFDEEDIQWEPEQRGGEVGRHVLEGGDSTVNPVPGSTGYQRLFGVLRPDYAPSSRLVRQTRERSDEQRVARGEALAP